LYKNDHNNESPEEFKRKKKEDEKNSAAEIQDSTTPEAMNTATLREDSLGSYGHGIKSQVAQKYSEFPSIYTGSY
jgi:hypothetical protein